MLIVSRNFLPFRSTHFQLGSCYSIFCFMCNVLQIVVCPSVLFSPLCCLSFFDLRILITSLVSSTFIARTRVMDSDQCRCSKIEKRQCNDFCNDDKVEDCIISQEELKDTKGAITIHKSKKDRQHNGQRKNNKRTNNDLQNTTQKTKGRTSRTPLKTGCEHR